MRFVATFFLLLLSVVRAQVSREVLLSNDNAYNPIPSPDGKYIAYVRTGWGQPGGSGGFGRSNLVSEVIVVDTSGSLVTGKPLCDEFLAGWMDSNHIVCFRDGRYMVASLDYSMPQESHLPTFGVPTGTERVSSTPVNNRVIWIRRLDDEDPESLSVVESPSGVIARHKGWLGEMVSTSPDGRYVAAAGAWNGSHLSIYDIARKHWTDLGEINIHPDSNWDYIKPSWNPWFRDSSRLAFFTHHSTVLSIIVPDGSQRLNISVSHKAGLATPSPDGQSVAYVTFDSRPMKLRSDLKFWGGTQIWVIPVAEQAHAVPITKISPDETFSLQWLNDEFLVFDRVAEVEFFRQARIWKTQISR